MHLVPLVTLRFTIVLSLLTALALLSGCAGDECTLACRHLIDDCGLDRPSYSVEDCSSGCTKFIEHYEDEWQQRESRQAVRCVANASCSELLEGMPCFEEAVYVW
jgi:hypothetical protein